MPELHDSLVKLISDYPCRDITVLFGAGISFNPPSNIPTVVDFTKSLLQALKARPELIHLAIDRIYSSNLPPRFEVLIDDIRKDLDPTLKIAELFSTNVYNENHALIAYLLRNGASAVTTNFDRCVEIALGDTRSIQINIFDGTDLSIPTDLVTNCFLKPHGSISDRNQQLVITIKALALTSFGYKAFPNWQKYLTQLFSKRLLLVVGYSGSDDFDITPVLLTASPENLVWLKHKANGRAPEKCYTNSDSNDAIYNKYKILKPVIYEGDTSLFSRGVLDNKNIKIAIPEGNPKQNKFCDYVEKNYRSETKKKELLNTLLLHYQMYDEVLANSTIGESSLLDLQCYKAQYSLGRYSELVNCYEDQLRVTNDGEYYSIYYYSSALSHLGKYEKSTGAITQLLEMETPAIDRELILRAQNHLGALYFVQGNYDAAETIYNKSLSGSKEISIESYATSLWGLGNIHFTKGEYNKSIDCYKESKINYEHLGAERASAYMELNIGESQLYVEAPDVAINRFLAAKTVFYRIRNAIGLLYAYNGLAKAYYKKGDLKKCDKYLSRALYLIKDNPGAPPAAYTYMLSFLLFVKIDNQAVHIKQKVVSLRRKLALIERSEAQVFLKEQLATLADHKLPVVDIILRVESYLFDISRKTK